MPIKYYCTGCRKKLSISRKKIGELVACPVCHQLTEIPPSNQTDSEQLELSESTGQVEFASAEEAQLQPAQSSDPPAFGATQDTSYGNERPSASLDPFFLVSSQPDETADDMFQIRRELEEDEGMDLTPMVDVTFLLLIFFMITASFTLEKTIPTPIPDPDQQSAAQPIPREDELLDKSIQIEITSNNTIRLDDEDLNDPATLRDQLLITMQREQKAEALIRKPWSSSSILPTKLECRRFGLHRIRVSRDPRPEETQFIISDRSFH